MPVMIIYCVIAVLLLLLELLYFKVADRYNIIDKPNLRSSHTYITLRGGGIIFPISVLVYTAFFGFGYGWFLIGLTALSVVSFVDDIKSVPNSIRLVVQFTAMFLMFWQWGIIGIDSWWVIILALIFCTGIINAYNFMDGINGITGGYSLAVLFPLLIVNRYDHFIEEPVIVVAILGNIIFCLFNFRKRAKCFAGDVGSVSMAFIVVFILGKLIVQTGNLCYIVFLAVYGVDTVLTICHRIMLHENLGVAHRKHAYQLMANELHIPHVCVSVLYMVLQFAISLGAIYIPMNEWLYLACVVCLLSFGYLLFMRKYYPLHEAYLRGSVLDAKSRHGK